MDINSVVGLVLGSSAVTGIAAYLVGKAANPVVKAGWSEEQALAARVHSPIIQSGFTYLMRIALRELSQEEPALVASLARLHVPASISTPVIESVIKDAPAQYQPAAAPASPAGSAGTPAATAVIPPVVITGESGPAGLLPTLIGVEQTGSPAGPGA